MLTLMSTVEITVRTSLSMKFVRISDFALSTALIGKCVTIGIFGSMEPNFEVRSE
jgi:hypothetical protein